MPRPVGGPVCSFPAGRPWSGKRGWALREEGRKRGGGGRTERLGGARDEHDFNGGGKPLGRGQLHTEGFAEGAERSPQSLYGRILCRLYGHGG